MKSWHKRVPCGNGESKEDTFYIKEVVIIWYVLLQEILQKNEASKSQIEEEELESGNPIGTDERTIKNVSM